MVPLEQPDTRYKAVINRENEFKKCHSENINIILALGAGSILETGSGKEKEGGCALRVYGFHTDNTFFGINRQVTLFQM